jgi:hypothetical protein
MIYMINRINIINVINNKHLIMGNNIFIVVKKPITITIDSEILKKIDSHCDENSAKRSTFINNRLKEYFKNKK